MDRKSLRSRIDAMFEAIDNIDGGLGNAKVCSETLIKIVDGIEAYVEDRLEDRIKEKDKSETQKIKTPTDTFDKLFSDLNENWEISEEDEDIFLIKSGQGCLLLLCHHSWESIAPGPVEYFELYKAVNSLGSSKESHEIPWGDMEAVYYKFPGREITQYFTIDEAIQIIKDL